MIMPKKRDLVYELVRKNLKVRYARPSLGLLWTFLSPFLLVAIFYIVFSIVLKVKIEEAPFVLYLMSAVFPWRFFQDSLVESTTSLVDNKNLIREARFPYYMIPVSIVFTNSIVFLPSLIILVFASLVILKGASTFILMLPLVLIIHFFITMWLSIIASLLYARWRDVKYILEPILVLLFYMTPVFYSVRFVKESFSPLLFKIYTYNPFVGILNFYRITLFKDARRVFQGFFNPLSFFVIPVCFSVATFILCLYIYRKHKNRIIDYVSF